jgi:hypothetical protein
VIFQPYSQKCKQKFELPNDGKQGMYTVDNSLENENVHELTEGIKNMLQN